MIREMVEKKGKELIFVQGQASLTHLAYAPVTLGILYGSRPHCIVMVHDPERTFRPGFPEQRVLEPSEEATLVAVLSGALPTGIALNTQKVKDWKAACLGKIDMNGKLRKGPGLRKAIAGLKVRGRSKGGGGK
jgi:uncharacterized NAD-dependent epimerase/dehydratase family protein